MSGPFGSQQFMYSAAAADFYEYQIANSIRMSSGADSKLSRSQGTPTSRDKMTLSLWVKRHDDSTTDSNNTIIVAGTGGATYFYASFGDNMAMENVGGNQSTAYLNTNAFWRDITAWYHWIFRIDTTQSSASDRIRMYMNGTQVTGFSNTTMQTNTAQNEDFSWLNQDGITIAYGGLSGSGHGTEGADLSFADIAFYDGQSYYSELGEFKNGVWIPKDPSGLTFGDNGYWLKFGDSSSLGTDSSGNGNTFTVANIASHDQLLDSPTFNDDNMGNVMGMNSLDHGTHSSCTFSEANFKTSLVQQNSHRAVRGPRIPDTGKWYWECDVDHTTNGFPSYLGVMSSEADSTLDADTNFTTAGSYFYDPNGGNARKESTSNTASTAPSAAGNADAIVSVAVDMDNDKIWFAQNGTWINIGGGVGNPATGANAIATLDEEDLCVAHAIEPATGTSNVYWNFGQDGTFCGRQTAQNNQDSNGYGNFYYSVPSGFQALCAANLPMPEEFDPNETDDDYTQKLFSPLLYTGDGSSRTISGLGFQPDLIWIKRRSGTGKRHYVVDSNRGLNSTSPYIHPDQNVSEGTGNSTGVSGANSDGFTIGGSLDYVNENTSTYVAWCWRANGGTTSTLTSGTINSTVQVDPTGYFSIIGYTADGTNGAFTVAHGLSATPSFILHKDLEQNRNWSVYHRDLNTGSPGDQDTLFLNASDAQADQGGSWDVSNITSTLIGCVDGGFMNTGTNTQIMYAWANREGYFRAGRFEGNNNTDGAIGYCGFRPAMIIVKDLDDAENFVIFDNERSSLNVVDDGLFPNADSAETTGSGSGFDVDFLANGFKMRCTHDNMNGGSTYVFAAWAEVPYKYATAV